MEAGEGGVEFGECYEIAQAISLAVVATRRRRYALVESRAKIGSLLRDADESSAAATAMLNSWIARQPMAAGHPALIARRNRPEGGTTA